DILLKKISPISVNQKLAQLNIKDNEVIKWKLDNAYRIVRTAASSSVKKLADEKKKFANNNFFQLFLNEINYCISSSQITQKMQKHHECRFCLQKII
ncbi:TPA: hypothetical protein ACFCEY_001839, partial [Neisseria gonorrhoeae]